MDLFFPLTCLAVAIPAIGAQYSMFQAAPAPKMIEDGKIHAMEHMISPIAVQPDPASAAAAAAAAAVIPAVSTPPPFQVEFLLQSLPFVSEASLFMGSFTVQQQNSLCAQLSVGTMESGAKKF